ncbi:hypothetical protein ACRAWG_06310 [Methylobacterium sp. P31]
MLTVADAFNRERLAIRVAHKLRVIDLTDVLPNLFIMRGVPAHIRSNDGSGFIAKSIQPWIAAVGARIADSTPSSPRGNGDARGL